MIGLSKDGLAKMGSIQKYDVIIVNKQTRARSPHPKAEKDKIYLVTSTYKAPMTGTLKIYCVDEFGELNYTTDKCAKTIFNLDYVRSLKEKDEKTKEASAKWWNALILFKDKTYLYKHLQKKHADQNHHKIHACSMFSFFNLRKKRLSKHTHKYTRQQKI